MILCFIFKLDYVHNSLIDDKNFDFTYYFGYWHLVILCIMMLSVYEGNEKLWLRYLALQLPCNADVPSICSSWKSNIGFSENNSYGYNTVMITYIITILFIALYLNVLWYYNIILHRMYALGCIKTILK